MKTLPVSTKKLSGFSLVEIALALGIVGFSLAALLGLLATASNVNAESGRETVMVSMTSQIMTNLRSVPFDALWDKEPRPDANDSSASQNDPEASIYYFTSEGMLLEDGEAVNNPETVYVCKVTKVLDTASQTPLTNTGSGSSSGSGTAAIPGRYNMLKLQLVYSWPANAPEANRQTHTIYASIARY